MRLRPSFFFPLFTILCCKINAFAATAVVVPPARALSEPTGSLSAYSGLGAAAPGDYSSTDVNPAIMSALKKQYILFGDTSWESRLDLVDFGVLDTSSTSVATVLRIRESIPDDVTPRDRRFTLGLSYKVPDTNFSFGGSFDYEQLSLFSFTKANDRNYFGGAGFLYEVMTKTGIPVFIGAGMTHLGDVYSPALYDIGASTTFLDGYYSANLDGLFSNLSGLQKIVGSLNIIVNQFMDIKGSYGYRTRDKRDVWGGGIFFHAPVLQLYYTFASSDSDDTTSIRQTAGCALNFVM